MEAPNWSVASPQRPPQVGGGRTKKKTNTSLAQEKMAGDAGMD